MSKTVVLIVASMALVWGPVASAQTVPQGGLDANCQVDAPQATGFNRDQRAAQTFTAVNSGKLTSARVLVSKDASDEPGDYALKIAAVNASGVPTAEVLASATIPGSSVPNGRQTITANFDPASAPTVTAGQKYALVVQRGNNDTLLTLPYRTDDPCPGGSVYWSTGGAPFWQSDGNRDLVFAIHVTPPDTTPPAAPEISSPADGSYAKDGAITFSGTAEANSTVEIFEGATLTGTATADARGSWQEAVGGVPEGGHNYTARATDAAGNTSVASDPKTVTVDTTRPRVVGAGPAAGAREVPPGAKVTAVFSEQMGPASVDEATFELVRKGTTRTVPAEVTYSAATRKAILDPIKSLKRGAVYRATVTTGAKDLAGNGLDQVPNRAGEQQKAWPFAVRR